MSDVLAELLAAVLAAPDDDAPRRVYADALLDRGEPRGELINLQCTLGERPADDEAARRAYQLQRAETAALDARWPATGTVWTFRRGFVEALEIDASAFVRHGAAIVAAEPLASVTLRHCERALVPALVEMPALARLRRMRLEHGSLGKHGLSELLASPKLGALHTLELPVAGLGTSSARVFSSADPTRLPQLARLDVKHNPLHDAGGAELAGSALCGRLEGLDVAGCRLTDRGVLAIAQRCRALRRLSVGRNRLGASALDAIATLPALEILDLRYGLDDDAAIARLAASRTLAAVYCDHVLAATAPSVLPARIAVRSIVDRLW